MNITGGSYIGTWPTILQRLGTRTYSYRERKQKRESAPVRNSSNGAT